MFWGLIMEPNKRYTQTVEKPFHISQAAMDTSTGDADLCQVMVVVDGKNFLVCTLQKNKTIQVPLDLYFKTGDVVSFLTNGKCNVHLTGYLDPDFEGESDSEEGEEEEEEEEAPALVPAKNKRKLDTSTETAAKKLKHEAKKQLTKKKAESDEEEDSSDEEGGEDDLLRLLDGEEVDTDENDESFKLNSTADDSESEEEDSDEQEAVAAEAAGLSDEEELETSKEVDSSKELDTSKEEPKKLSKAQKKRLKKKQQQLAEQGKTPLTNGVDKKKDGHEKVKGAKAAASEKAEKREKREKKVLGAGVHIEDLKVGSGPVAKAGKIVQVYYEGRLKANNKMFDSCSKGPGFKFRLGSKEVISGWDVGVAGMKVGGKRRILCPPAMAYGAKGSPPVIPPNAALVFEVELKNIK